MVEYVDARSGLTLLDDRTSNPMELVLIAMTRVPVLLLDLEMVGGGGSAAVDDELLLPNLKAPWIELAIELNDPLKTPPDAAAAAVVRVSVDAVDAANTDGDVPGLDAPC